MLVADDDEATRLLLQAALGADGLQVVLARDSNEAVSALALERIDSTLARTLVFVSRRPSCGTLTWA